MTTLPLDLAYQDALAFLYGRLNYERTEQMPYGPAELKLDRMRRLLELVGNPHQRCPIVHVAGTKGKGSTSQFLSSILTRAGYRTGCYTSPHLLHVEERFAVDGQPCTRHDLVRCVDRLRPLVDQLEDEDTVQGGEGPTFFELATAIALMHFAERQTDFTILEVGLGGRLDSTNVCQPVVSVITSISFDHMRQLGNTLSAIAGEKAGIIKPGIPVVTGVTGHEALSVIQRVAGEQNAPILRLGRDFDYVYQRPDSADGVVDPRMDYLRMQVGQDHDVARDIVLPALGAHQAANASLAWATCESLREQGFEITESAMREGLATSCCPARIEILRQNPTVIIDTAHNAASIEALVRVFRESFPQRPRTLILAASQGKDVAGMLHALVPEFDTIVCTQYVKNPRSMSAEELQRHARRIATAEGCVLELFTSPSPRDAWELAQRQSPPPGLICATGSFFLAAEMREILESS